MFTLVSEPGAEEEALVGWVTLDEARTRYEWADAETIDDDALTDLLLAAHEQCAAYAPALAADAEVPASWKRAQVMQARALYRSATAGRENQMGDGEFTVTVWPMDWTVKNLLRPKRGRPLIR